jgi:hypothetical protein
VADGNVHSAFVMMYSHTVRSGGVETSFRDYGRNASRLRPRGQWEELEEAAGLISRQLGLYKLKSRVFYT